MNDDKSTRSTIRGWLAAFAGVVSFFVMQLIPDWALPPIFLTSGLCFLWIAIHMVDLEDEVLRRRVHLSFRVIVAWFVVILAAYYSTAYGASLIPVWITWIFTLTVFAFVLIRLWNIWTS